MGKPKDTDRDAEILNAIDKKWSGFEHGMRDQLEAKLLEYQAMMADRGTAHLPKTQSTWSAEKAGAWVCWRTTTTVQT